MGEPYRPPSLLPGEVPKTDPHAVAALVVGILSFFVCPVVLSLVAIGEADKARTRIKLMKGALVGDGLAVAGMVLGWVSLALSLLVVMAWLWLN